MRDDTPKAVRDQFEAVLWENFRLSATAQMLTSKEPGKLRDREVYFKADANGDYADESTAAMWLTWKLCMRANGDAFVQASMWRAFVAVQERIDAELPATYTMAMVWEKNDKGEPGNYIALNDDQGDEVEYPDPPGLSAAGSVFRIMLAALEEAKKHYAMRQN